MSREAWGDPPDPEPIRCPECCNTHHTDGCEMCALDKARIAAESERAAAPERAWLVEWNAHGYGPQWWGFNFEPGRNGDWCDDANKAVRFSRQEDAERMRLHIIAAAGCRGNHTYERTISTTEHEWPNDNMSRI